MIRAGARTTLPDMSTILIAFLILVCILMVLVILAQRSEGGALGMGGGPSGFMTARGAGDFLTRTTWILASLFFTCAILLIIVGNHDRSASLFKNMKLAPIPASAPTRQGPALAQRPGPGGASDRGRPAEPARGRRSGPVRRDELRRLRDAVGQARQARQLGRARPEVRRVDRHRHALIQSRSAFPNHLSRRPARIGRKPDVPWPGTSSSPAAWSPHWEKVSPPRRSARCCRRAATRSGCASSTPI